MSYLLESLGRGLLGQLLDAFETQLPSTTDDDPVTLTRRAARSPGSADLGIRLGLTHLRAMKLRDAAEQFERVRKLSNEPRLAEIGLACVSDELGRLPEALRHLQAAHLCDPTDPATVFAMAFCHERLGDRDNAAAYYREALRRCPNLRNAHERLAAIAVFTGDFDAAAACYETLADLDAGDVDVLMTLAALYLRQGRADRAIEQFQEALLIEPESMEGSPLEDDALEGDQAVEQAIAVVSDLAQKYPGVADFQVHLGDLYARCGDDRRATDAYQAALLVQPNYLEATIKLGAQHLRRKRFVDAAQMFNRAVELNDRLMTAFVGLGVAQRVAGREQEARASLDLAASLEPNSVLLFSEASRLQRKVTGRRAGTLATVEVGEAETIGETLRRYQRAIAARPAQADLHYRYGLLLRHVGRLADAICAFREALTISPSYLKAMIKLAVCLKETGQGEEADALFARAVTLEDRDVPLHYELALLFAQRNHFDLTVERFAHEHRHSPAGQSLRENLRVTLQNVGVLDAASANWRAICELSAADSAFLQERTHSSGQSE